MKQSKLERLQKECKLRHPDANKRKPWTRREILPEIRKTPADPNKPTTQPDWNALKKFCDANF